MSGIRHRCVLGLVVLAGLVVAGGFVWSERGRDAARIMTVDGISMQPTLNPGDRVRLNPSGAAPYRRGDLVAIRFHTRKHLMVKRIIAVAGDEVRWRDGRLTVNGAAPHMAGWPADRRVRQRDWKLLGIQLSRYDHRVPGGNVIVMGDNGPKSFDSGDFGMVSIDQLAGHIEP